MKSVDKSAPHRIRRRILELSCSAKSAHVGSALSCVELVYMLLRERVQKEGRLDKLILSKGHAAMALYATAEELSLIETRELDSYLADGTNLWGHPAMNGQFPFIDWSTGSLGHGLPVSAGFAYSRKKLGVSHRGLVAAILSDGECDEGTVWEAALFAGHHQLSNLLAFVDYNKIQSFGACEQVMRLEPFVDKWKAFGWDSVEIDGHDLEQVERILESKTSDKPRCVIAHTIKGKGLKSIENTLISHYRPISQEQIREFDREK